MNTTKHAQVDWWLGVTDVLANGLAHGAEKAQRVHLSIADETFNILARIPVTRPVSEPVRKMHHGISRLSYGSVSRLAAVLAAGSQQVLSHTATTRQGEHSDSPERD
ncbi:MAG: hypothetical protein R3276_03165 [Marinobacter sp.]|nr:hypothetical protein [Marinobacter sp.]